MSIAPSLRLDPQAPLPLHAQVERLLREMIREESYQHGKLLPDEVSLARQLGVSRNTLRVAISRLVYAGLIERRAGVGTRVRTCVESDLGQWNSFSSEMERKGVKVETYSTSARLEEARADAGQALQIEPRRRVLRVDRLRGWDQTPLVHFRSFLHPRLGLSDTLDFTRPLYDVIRSQSGVVPATAREQMRAVGADVALSRIFQIRRGTPLLLRERVVYDSERRPVEYSVVHYLSTHFTLSYGEIRAGQ